MCDGKIMVNIKATQEIVDAINKEIDKLELDPKFWDYKVGEDVEVALKK